MNKSIRGRKAAPAQKADLYQQVTDKIIAALEKGVPPWRRPWRSAQNVHGSALPVNATTGRHYSGVNIPLLWMSAEERGFSSDRWLTYQQAKAVGGQVRKGETSSMAIIYKPFEKQATDGNDNKLFDKDGNPVMESLAMLKPLQLFNVAQCDGLPDAVAGMPTRRAVAAARAADAAQRLSPRPRAAAPCRGRADVIRRPARSARRRRTRRRARPRRRG